MRDQLKGLFPHLREVLNCEFLDGEIYKTSDSNFNSILTYNYNSIKNTHIPNLLKRNRSFSDSYTKICCSIIEMLQKENLENIDNIFIMLDSKCLLKMQKKTNDINLVIYLKTEDKDYGFMWKYLGRPIYKRLGWRILE